VVFGQYFGSSLQLRPHLHVLVPEGGWDAEAAFAPLPPPRRTPARPAVQCAGMGDRDVERNCSKADFVATLRRVANALERGESVRIQVVGKRFTVPADASLSIEHEADAGNEELELQLRWRADASS
jgi:amphi-Trp domain-containing protein